MDPDTGDGGTGRHRERARRLAASADHDSVTEDLLVGGGRFSGTFYLYDAPAVAHLDEDERPRFAFFNHMKGIDDGGGADAPDTNGIAIVLVTGRRVLALVGHEDGDRTLSLHYDVITEVGYEAGELHHRIAVGTAEEAYTLWVSRQFDEAALERAVSFVRDRMVDPDVIVDRVDAPPAQGQDGGSVASDGGPSADAAAGGAGGPDGSPGEGDPAGTWDAPPTDTDGELFDLGDDAGDASPGDASDGGSSDHGDGSSDAVEGSGSAGGGSAGPDATGGDGTGGPDATGSDGTGGPDATGDGGAGRDPLARIEKLHSLKEAGAITEAEYEEKKAELLDRV